MNDLPGNDYVALSRLRIEGVHEVQSAEGMTDATLIAAALDANTQATLALAFEQRTATLVNLVRMYADLGGADYTERLVGDINDRLGLNSDRVGLNREAK